MPEEELEQQGQVEEVRLEHPAADFAAQYVDIINIEATADSVYLTLIQRLPSGVKPNARLVARVSICWPLLIRTKAMIDRVIKANGTKALKSFNDAFVGQLDSKQDKGTDE